MSEFTPQYIPNSEAPENMTKQEIIQYVQENKFVPINSFIFYYNRQNRELALSLVDSGELKIRNCIGYDLEVAIVDKVREIRWAIMEQTDYKRRLEALILKFTLSKKHNFSYAEILREIVHFFPELKSQSSVVPKSSTEAKA
jgi:abortive infection bacteriophage resistance protein